MSTTPKAPELEAPPEPEMVRGLPAAWRFLRHPRQWPWRYIAAMLLPAVGLVGVIAISYAPRWLQGGYVAVLAVVWTVAACLAAGLPNDGRVAWDAWSGDLWGVARAYWRALLFIAVVCAVAVPILASTKPPLATTWLGFGFGLSAIAYGSAWALAWLRLCLNRTALMGTAVCLIVWGVLTAWPLLVMWFLGRSNDVYSVQDAAIVALGVPVGIGLLVCFFTTIRLAPTGAPATETLVGRWRARISIGSVSLSIASGVLLLACAVAIPIERSSDETSAIAARGAILPPPADISSQNLLNLYAPVLRLDPTEQWIEEPVDAFLGDVAFVTTNCPQPSLGIQREPRRAKPCLALNPGTTAADSRGPLNGYAFHYGLAYPDVANHIANPSLLSTATAKFPNDRAVQPIIDTRRVLEYWLFYRFDRWRDHTSLGWIDQQHQGDWEVVYVGLRANDTPTFVGYSEHCGGTWRPWTDVPVVAERGGTVVLGARQERLPASHPLVVVAKGSHANYPTAGEREPDWSTCMTHSRPFQVATQLVSFGADIRESTPLVGPIEVPSVATLAVGQATLTEPWWWGSFETDTLRSLQLQPPGKRGPPSPGYQGAKWSDPISVIFGDSRWSCDVC